MISSEGCSHSCDQPVEVMSIWGMGEVGKTTLAQLVYNDERVLTHFELRMWVSTPVDFDVGTIIKRMINSANEEIFVVPSEDEQDRLENKLKDLLNKKRYLLVLDDVWNEDLAKWDNLNRILIACGGNQESQILVTSRSEICLQVMGSQNRLNLSHLSDGDSWDLFSRQAFSTSEPSEDLILIGKEIFRKCGGLPLAIRAVGKMMSNKKGASEWESILQSNIWSQGINPELKISYSQLSPCAKQCSAFCAIFSKGFEMSKEQLLQLWKASGCITQNTKEDVFNELVQRCFLQKSDEPRCFFEKNSSVLLITPFRMHDLMHDLASSFFSDVYFDMENGSEMGKEIPRSIQHMLVPYGSLPDCTSMTSSTKIRTVLSLPNGISEEIIGNIYKDLNPTLDFMRLRMLSGSGVTDLDRKIFKRSRILSLSRVGGVVKLMKSVCQFEHLKYLDLSFNDSLEELPEAIGELLNLQTLKLTCCSKLKELPEAIASMLSLEHLHIEGCFLLRRLPANISRLTSLETLSMFFVGRIEEGRGISELKNMNRLGGLLELHNLQAVAHVSEAAEADMASKRRLQALRFHWEDHTQDDLPNQATITMAEQVLEALKPSGNAKLIMLSIFKYMGRQLSTWIGNEFHNLREVCISGSRMCIRLPPLWKLHSLQFLDLNDLDSVKHFVRKC